MPIIPFGMSVRPFQETERDNRRDMRTLGKNATRLGEGEVQEEAA